MFIRKVSNLSKSVVLYSISIPEVSSTTPYFPYVTKIITRAQHSLYGQISPLVVHSALFISSILVKKFLYKVSKFIDI